MRLPLSRGSLPAALRQPTVVLGLSLVVLTGAVGVAGAVSAGDAPARAQPFPVSAPAATRLAAPDAGVLPVGDAAPAALPAAGVVPRPAAAPGSPQAGALAVLPSGPLGIPGAVLAAYRKAADELAASTPGCHVGWNLLAGIGRIESGHASGGRVDAAGTTLTPILGPVLDGANPGDGVVRDTDGGRLDGDTSFDRAVGPMQFIPGTWAAYGADGSGDGVADPNNVVDAALAAGRYLCSGGLDLAVPAQARAAVLRYNSSDAYADNVLSWAAAYARGVAPTDADPAPAPSSPAPGQPVPAAAPTPGAPDVPAPSAVPAPAEPVAPAPAAPAPPTSPRATTPRPVTPAPVPSSAVPTTTAATPTSPAP